MRFVKATFGVFIAVFLVQTVITAVLNGIVVSFMNIIPWNFAVDAGLSLLVAGIIALEENRLPFGNHAATYFTVGAGFYTVFFIAALVFINPLLGIENVRYDGLQLTLLIVSAIFTGGVAGAAYFAVAGEKPCAS